MHLSISRARTHQQHPPNITFESVTHSRDDGSSGGLDAYNRAQVLKMQKERAEGRTFHDSTLSSAEYREYKKGAEMDHRHGAGNSHAGHQPSAGAPQASGPTHHDSNSQGSVPKSPDQELAERLLTAEKTRDPGSSFPPDKTQSPAAGDQPPSNQPAEEKTKASFLSPVGREVLDRVEKFVAPAPAPAPASDPAVDAAGTLFGRSREKNAVGGSGAGKPVPQAERGD